MSDGTSKTVVIGETREEKLTSWYSGFASYCVGAWPMRAAPRGSVVGQNSTQPVVWTFVFGSSNGESSLNKGHRTNDPMIGAGNNGVWYMDAAKEPHCSLGDPPASPSGEHKWGPSSLHPGVVQHGWGDGRGSQINDTIDGDVYLHIITRNGRETDSISSTGS
jgi:hypothetical protein